MTPVLGLDVSANRIAWAFTNGTKCETGIVRRSEKSFDVFVSLAAKQINSRWGEGSDWLEAEICLEINLRPAWMWRGASSPHMVESYMRSRWIEGALIDRLCHEEPQKIERIHNAWKVKEGSQVHSLQASGGKDAKANRRRRMSLIYHFIEERKLSEDEIDALAIAHECYVALRAGIRV